MFQLAPLPSAGSGWKKKTIYSFTGGSDGAYPADRLQFHNGALYGTTEGGGSCLLFSQGCGVVFELAPESGSGWQLTVLHTFAGGEDGAAPLSGVISDANGNAYGTTYYGGGAAGCTYGCGTVYELSPAVTVGAWTETLLYAFSGSSDGGLPGSGLTQGRSGLLYGVSGYFGAYDGGLVFQLSPPSTPGSPWTQSVLYAFKGGKYDGAGPVGELVFDHSGNIFGATASGGIGSSSCGPGCGTVFKLAPPSTPGGAWTERLLHKFGTGTDGTVPMGGVLMDSSGALYGATYDGGDSAVCTFRNGCGTVYKLAKPATSGGTWDETLLYSFGGDSDGLVPNGGLLFDSNWNIYGTTEWGGDSTGGDGYGTVFEITQ